jgi:hypothetical protein
LCLCLRATVNGILLQRIIYKRFKFWKVKKIKRYGQSVKLSS